MNLTTILLAGLATLALRAAFVFGDPPRWEKSAQPYLRRVGPAVLPTLALSMVMAHQQAAPAGAGTDMRHWAIIVACALAWKTRDILLPLAVGMLAIWLLESEFSLSP